MHVDEPGRQRQTVASNALERVAFGQVADERNAAVDDGDVGPIAGASRPVNDAGAF
ncbi:MAG: hypothetical protein ABR591_02840 [Candidatus Velthaea sp.]